MTKNLLNSTCWGALMGWPVPQGPSPEPKGCYNEGTKIAVFIEPASLGWLIGGIKAGYHMIIDTTLTMEEAKLRADKPASRLIH